MRTAANPVTTTNNVDLSPEENPKKIPVDVQRLLSAAGQLGMQLKPGISAQQAESIRASLESIAAEISSIAGGFAEIVNFWLAKAVEVEGAAKTEEAAREANLSQIQAQSEASDLRIARLENALDRLGLLDADTKKELAELEKNKDKEYEIEFTDKDGNKKTARMTGREYRNRIVRSQVAGHEDSLTPEERRAFNKEQYGHEAEPTPEEKGRADAEHEETHRMTKGSKRIIQGEAQAAAKNEKNNTLSQASNDDDLFSAFNDGVGDAPKETVSKDKKSAIVSSGLGGAAEAVEKLKKERPGLDALADLNAGKSIEAHSVNAAIIGARGASAGWGLS